MKHKKYIIIAIVIIALLILFFSPPSIDTLRGNYNESRRIYDCNGILLREIIGDNGGVMRWTPLSEISPYTIEAAIFSEDKHFYRHPGIDPKAIIRSIFQIISKKRIVSGASTITMQVARLTYPIKNWNPFIRKIAEIVLALKIDLWLTKNEIMEIYLNRVYFGNMLYGINAASESYFNKSPRILSLKESLILINSIQAPSLCNPLYRDRVMKKADRMAQLMKKAGLLNDAEMEQYANEQWIADSINFVFRAPHVTDRIIIEMNGKDWKEVYSTIDVILQEKVEKTIKSTLKQFENKRLGNGGVIVINAHSGGILALVGSKSYFDEGIEGQYNTVYGFRSPGSSLKPFTYALGLMNGYNACTIIEDEPVYFKEPYGDYKPENYDFKFHGKVSLRQALGCSYNVPAVKILNSIGYEKLYQMLKMMYFYDHGYKAEHYGLAITLGSMSVNLFHLASAYTVFPNGGVYKKARIVDSFKTFDDSIIIIKSDSLRIMPQWTSFIIADILSDNNARIPAFNEENPFKLPFYVGVKTGTSKNYKDNLSIGFTGNYVIGVWAGNNDNEPMVNVSGITGAGVLFRNILMDVYSMYEIGVRPSIPDSIAIVNICRNSGNKASSYCKNIYSEYIYINNSLPQCTECGNDWNYSEDLPRIIYPDNGDIFVIDNEIDATQQSLKIKIENMTGKESVFIDTCLYENEMWQLRRGIHTVKIKRNDTLLDSVTFEVR